MGQPPSCRVCAHCPPPAPTAEPRLQLPTGVGNNDSLHPRKMMNHRGGTAAHLLFLEALQGAAWKGSASWKCLGAADSERWLLPAPNPCRLILAACPELPACHPRAWNPTGRAGTLVFTSLATHTPAHGLDICGTFLSITWSSCFLSWAVFGVKSSVRTWDLFLFLLLRLLCTLLGCPNLLCPA